MQSLRSAWPTAFRAAGGGTRRVHPSARVATGDCRRLPTHACGASVRRVRRALAAVVTTEVVEGCRRGRPPYPARMRQGGARHHRPLPRLRPRFSLRHAGPSPQHRDGGGPRCGLYPIGDEPKHLKPHVQCRAPGRAVTLDPSGRASTAHLAGFIDEKANLQKGDVIAPFWVKLLSLKQSLSPWVNTPLKTTRCLFRS